MGTWGYGIFDDDTALDIKGDFEDYLEEGLSISEATERILEDYEEVTEDEEDGAIVYLALASLQIEKDALEDEIRSKALSIIENDIGLEIWTEEGKGERQERKKVLEELKIRLMQ